VTTFVFLLKKEKRKQFSQHLWKDLWGAASIDYFRL
jgi:hypothetical protein